MSTESLVELKSSTSSIFNGNNKIKHKKSKQDHYESKSPIPATNNKTKANDTTTHNSNKENIQAYVK